MRRGDQSDCQEEGKLHDSYNQCLQEVRDKLESSNKWEKIQHNQWLHKLMMKIERICVGFNDHNQEVFNLAPSLKMLFLYTQGEKETVEENSQNFKSLWSTIEAFGGYSGVHKGLVNRLLADTSRVRDVNNVTSAEQARAREDACKVVEAMLIISSADKKRYRQLKEQLTNNYLLETNQYPDTLEKASKILGSYQRHCAIAPLCVPLHAIALLQCYRSIACRCVAVTSSRRCVVAMPLCHFVVATPLHHCIVSTPLHRCVIAMPLHHCVVATPSCSCNAIVCCCVIAMPLFHCMQLRSCNTIVPSQCHCTIV